MAGASSKTFISYAREDAEFALKLAKDLRDAGADIWIDQLDIPAGTPWDDVAEEGLSICPSFLVILSPASVASKNVKNEIAFALDEDKQIIPVLFKECKVPLNVRRLQRVDVTGDYETGLAELAGALGVESESVAEKAGEERTVPAPVPGPAEPQEVVETRPVAHVGLGPWLRSHYRAAALLLVPFVLLLGWWIWPTSPHQIPETARSEEEEAAHETKTPSADPTPKPPKIKLGTEQPAVKQKPVSTPSAPRPTEPVPTPRPIEIRTSPMDGLDYVWIPPSEFLMGAVPGDDDAQDDEKPQHRVRITKGFWLSRGPVSVAAYERFVQETGAIMPRAPYFNSGWRKKHHPIVRVSWYDAVAYCKWAGGRLPTEAEWECAARGGKQDMKYAWGNEINPENANYGGSETSLVGSYPPNNFELHDMAGNVSEWVADRYDSDYYRASPRDDPPGPSTGNHHVLRGGSWYSEAPPRTSSREKDVRVFEDSSAGFRCAREVSRTFPRI